MPETQAQTGDGTKFRMGNGATPEVFADVGEVKAIDLPEETVEIQDATHLNSPNGYREKLAGLKDAGEVSITLNHTRDAETKMRAVFGTRKTYRVEFADGDVLEFRAINNVNYRRDTIEPGAIQTATVGFTVTGKPTYTPGP